MPVLSAPGPQRRRELEAAFERNTVANRAPYAGVWIRTLGELLWILEVRNWTGQADAEGRLRPDLRGAILAGTDLRGAVLHEANFVGARLDRANLASTNLIKANLSGAELYESTLRSSRLFRAKLECTDLNRADLSNADLGHAELTGAYLFGANLTGADLVSAKLKQACLVQVNLTRARLFGADLSFADLQGARLAAADLSYAILTGSNLSETLMDEAVQLNDVRMDARTNLCDVRWGGVALTQIEWSSLHKLGEESATQTPRIRSQRIAAYQRAARAYRGLAIALRQQGLTTAASHYRLLEHRMERHALRYERRYASWLFSLLLAVVAGYGERPGRTLATYVSILTAFTSAYIVLARFHGKQLAHYPLYFWPALSVSSFHGRGFFPNLLPQSEPLTLLALVEAILGVFIELVFIATFSRRFLGS